MAFDVPEETLVALKLDASSAANELRFVAAVKLFELGRVKRTGTTRWTTYTASGNAYFDPQTGYRVQAVDRCGFFAAAPDLRHGGLRAVSVAAQKYPPVCNAVERHDVGICLC